MVVHLTHLGIVFTQNYFYGAFFLIRHYLLLKWYVFVTFVQRVVGGQVICGDHSCKVASFEILTRTSNSW